MRKILAVGSIGVIFLFVLVSLNSVIASNAVIQSIKEKNRTSISFNDFINKMKNRQELSFSFWDLLIEFIFSMIVWFYINIWAHLGN